MAKKRKNTGGKGGGKGGKNCVAYDEDYEAKQPTRASTRKRSHKKKQNDQFAIDNKLRDMVEADGMTIVDMNPDGNCLFRALSDQLYGDLGNSHDIVRDDICNFMEANQDDFQVFLVLDDDDCEEEEEDAKDFEGYMATMRQDGEWGGNLELVAAARLYRRKITVFSATLAALTIDHDGKESSGPEIHLSFHDNDHYNSVRDENIQVKPPPRKNKPTQQKKKQAKGKQKGAAACDTTVGDDSVPKEAERTSSDSNATLSINESMSELTLKSDDAPKEQQEGSKPLKKNDTCPCGSGLRYKKCCLAREKHAKRLESMKNKNSSGEDNAGEKQQDYEMKGNFRVLQI